jgi:hypothetical protein
MTGLDARNDQLEQEVRRARVSRATNGIFESWTG